MSSAIAKMKKTSAPTPCKTMRGHTHFVREVVHLPGGEHILTCSLDGSLRLWNLASGTQTGKDWRDQGDQRGFVIMALSPDGKTVASGSNDGIVRLWDVKTGKVIDKWIGHCYEVVLSVCWSPDGERVMIGSDDGTVSLWDVKSGEVQGLDSGHDSLCAVSYSPNGTKIAVTGGYHEGALKVWDAKTVELLYNIEYDGSESPWSLAWTSDEKTLFVGSGRNGLIRILDTVTWQQIAVLEGHTDIVSSITLSRNNRLLASASWDKTARLWNLDTNLPVGQPLPHEHYVDCAALSADGKLLSTACFDGNAHVWDINAILKVAGLQDLLSIPDAQKSELKKKANATRRPARPNSRRVPPGFFDDGPSFTTRHLHPDPSLRHRLGAFAPSWGSRALLTRLPQLFRRSQPNADGLIELQQRPGPKISTRSSPRVVEVAAQQDKKALYVARRPERASDKAKRIKNPTWWVRIVLFICCASPGSSTDDSH